MSSPPAEETVHLTVPDLARRWKTTETAIRIRRHRGKAPKGFRAGGRVLFPLTAVEEFEAEQMAEDRPSHRGTTVEHRPAEPLRARRPAKA
ncbi:helix-turn-helix transcriptional regulator [Streptomyces sp. BBFR109]|uniref:helix-turn-helix transcriptional regulator n=1 Tax=Streptomyces sp. BBFR109 TaxID=3448172 RepID=UPI003F76B59C